MPKRTEAEILRDLRNIESALSPENLHCDGEISPAQARAKGRKLEAQQRALHKELGRVPSDHELYGR